MSETIRCICAFPGDTANCPVDHDQIQHERAVPTPEQIRERLKADFRREVQDKLGVVFHVARNPLRTMRASAVQQCEDFLCEQFDEALSLLDQRDAEIQQLTAAPANDTPDNLILNAYGRRCYNAGRASTEASLLRITEERDQWKAEIAAQVSRGEGCSYPLDASALRGNATGVAEDGSVHQVRQEEAGRQSVPSVRGDQQQACSTVIGATQSEHSDRSSSAVSPAANMEGHEAEASEVADLRAEFGKQAAVANVFREAWLSADRVLTEVHEQIKGLSATMAGWESEQQKSWPDHLGILLTLSQIRSVRRDLDALLAPPEEKKDER